MRTLGAVSRVALIGGSPERSDAGTIRRVASSCDAVVAIDRGLDAARDAGIGIDLFCGDVDSVSAEGAALVRTVESAGDAASFAVERYDPHKDFTDLSLVLRAVGERWGAPALACTCLGGGSPDHLLGVFGRLAAWPGTVRLVEDGFEGRMLRSGESWSIEGSRGSRFSFIPLSPMATVTERGMRWELDRHDAELLSDLGISNVIEHDPATIICHAGTLVCWRFNR